MSKANARVIYLILLKVSEVLARLSNTANMLSMHAIARDVGFVAAHAKRVAERVKANKMQ